VRVLIIIAVAIFVVAWVAAVVDVFRRSDLSGLGKIGWALAMLVFPFIGLAVYTLARAARP
jgi:hypothetical protein